MLCIKLCKGGGLWRDQEFKQEVITRLTVIETKLDNYSKVEDKAETAYVIAQANSKEITEMKEKIKWISRTAIGAIITGIIGIGIIFIKNGIGIT